jgi:hypothetical protein
MGKIVTLDEQIILSNNEVFLPATQMITKIIVKLDMKVLRLFPITEECNFHKVKISATFKSYFSS